MLTLDVQAKARDFYERYFTSIIPGTNFEFLKHEVLITADNHNLVRIFGQVAVCIMAALVTEARKRNLI